MKIKSTFIKDLLIIEPEVFNDDRGYFMESYNQKNFLKKLPQVNFCQDNESKSSYGTLRGLHFQSPPFDQTKLVRVVSGRVLDVVVDIRKNSFTYGKYFSIELNHKNKRQLFIPKGFAHGFLVLSSEAIFSYKVDNHYSKDHDNGIHFLDKEINIDWRIDIKKIRISKKDGKLPYFSNINSPF